MTVVPHLQKVDARREIPDAAQVALTAFDRGLAAVDVASDGTVGNLQRLFDASLFQPNVTGAGTLFGIALPALDWTLYQLGQL